MGRVSKSVKTGYEESDVLLVRKESISSPGLAGA